MRFSVMVLLTAAACKATPTDTDPQVDCNSEGTAELQTVAVPDWPAGLEEAIDHLNSLDGRWTAEACGTDLTVSIRTPAPTATGTEVEVITSPFPTGHNCGCTSDNTEAKDGSQDVIAYTTIDFSVQDYPNSGFREENAGNVASMPVALFGSGTMLVRGCVTQPVPPIIGSDYTDTDVIFRSGTSGQSGDVRLFQLDGALQDACPLTNWVRVGAN